MKINLKKKEKIKLKEKKSGKSGDGFELLCDIAEFIIEIIIEIIFD
ncbi:MAG: hypothetical protein K2J40_06395 [Ruminococcus sp.]|nr:hypothetical protein [Ruminococcus sp.]